MGYTIIELKLPTNYTHEMLRATIAKRFRISEFSFQIENQSLDARNKNNIHWLVRVGVSSKQIKGDNKPLSYAISIPYAKRNKKVLVVGSGPAGFFAGFYLQKAGFEVTIIDRGTEVETRAKGIAHFEKTGKFNPNSNYAFGEGGAGTFSDGKLTSRSKHISTERAFFISRYIEAGAPEEIAYLSHPHVGSDNLRLVVKNLRERFIANGGQILFETQCTGLEARKGMVKAAITSKGNFEADFFLVASGHSANDTNSMLIDAGVQFRLKNFAIGSRAEHDQTIINKAQWGVEKLAGVKAAEYRLTSKINPAHGVYSFCMCPGGMVVPAAAYDKTSVVNGMSYYKRGGRFANAACVAGLHPTQLSDKIKTPQDALFWVQDLEAMFYHYTGGFSVPACTISEFLNGKISASNIETSYPLGAVKAPLWELLPATIVEALRQGLKDFSRKLRGYETGTLLGLESKTSSPIQVIRDETGNCSGFANLFVIGEGSGYAGGIVSSAADGIRVAMEISN